jgi:hypothetical protein
MFLDSLRRDLLYAGRTMRHNVTFTVVVVLTLAVGIGANTAVFSVLDGVPAEAVAVSAGRGNWWRSGTSHLALRDRVLPMG